MKQIWEHLRNEDNRKRLAFLGAIIGALTVVGWTLFQYPENNNSYALNGTSNVTKEAVVPAEKNGLFTSLLIYIPAGSRVTIFVESKNEEQILEIETRFRKDILQGAQLKLVEPIELRKYYKTLPDTQLNSYTVHKSIDVDYIVKFDVESNIASITNAETLEIIATKKVYR